MAGARRLLILPPLAYLAVFFLYPLLAILARSLDGGALTLHPFQALLGDSYYWGRIWFTTWQAAASTVLTLAVGLPAPDPPAPCLFGRLLPLPPPGHLGPEPGWRRPDPASVPGAAGRLLLLGPHLVYDVAGCGFDRPHPGRGPAGGPPLRQAGVSRQDPPEGRVHSALCHAHHRGGHGVRGAAGLPGSGEHNPDGHLRPGDAPHQDCQLPGGHPDSPRLLQLRHRGAHRLRLLGELGPPRRRVRRHVGGRPRGQVPARHPPDAAAAHRVRRRAGLRVLLHVLWSGAGAWGVPIRHTGGLHLRADGEALSPGARRRPGHRPNGVHLRPSCWSTPGSSNARPSRWDWRRRRPFCAASADSERRRWSSPSSLASSSSCRR